MLLAVVASCLLLPNLGILAMHALADGSGPNAMRLPVKNFAEVDQRLWRGAAPTEAGYRALAARGVTTVVDLRAEDGIRSNDALLGQLGITRVHLPLRDGQSPTTAQVERFLEVTERSPGRTYVHCGAGVGRTGTMAAAYLVRTRQASGQEAVERNLSVGTPSIEQLTFSAGLDGAQVRRPWAPVVAVSRIVEAPRRLWVRVRKTYR